jgi:hypothetical protein
MKLKQETEKALKRFLKQKVSIAVAVVTAFLITGGIAEATSAGAASTAIVATESAGNSSGLLADELFSKIDVLRAEVEAQIAENEARLKELEMDELNLLRKGDYYSKPVYPSTQILMSSVFENAGKMKDRTRSAFAQELGIVEEYIRTVLGEPVAASPSGYVPMGVSTSTGGGNISGLTPELKKAYESGQISLSDLALLLLQQGNGAVAVGDPHSIDIDLGVNITLLHPEIPVVTKSVDVSVDAPSIPSVTVAAPTPNVPSFSAPVVTAPTIGVISAPTISLNVTAPDAVPAITVGSVSPSAPAGVSLTAPSVNVSVTPPVVTPNMSQPPVTPNAPAGFSIVISPQSPTTPTAPTAPPAVAAPATPPTPVINLFNPINIAFSSGGFGQPWGAHAPGGNGNDVMAENFADYNSSGITITAGTNQTYTGGDVTLTRNDSNSRGWASLVGTYSLNTRTGGSVGGTSAFISHVDDIDVTVRGNYTMTATAGGNQTKIFASVNPYETGVFTSANKTFDFQGNLTLNTNYVSGSAQALVGMEHQLLAHGGGGGENFPNINAGTTHILRNSGTITLGSGFNMVGIMIDTEYFGGTAANSAFVAKPHTENTGTIIISANAQNSVGIDYGFYYQGADNWGPNTIVSLGNIVINGQGNYGYRLRNYYGQNAGQGNGNIYYDLIEADGSGGTITVRGTQNVGISVAQGHSTGDPVQNFRNLNILVGGTNNVGFYRNPNYTGTNHNAMVFTAAKMASLAFESTATQSALLRSDLDEIQLDRDLSLTAGSTGNTALQAGGTGRVTLNASRTITSSLPTFYGLTAGDFSSSTGATATNHGTLTLSGANSVGLAIAASNTGATDGNITVSGASGIGVFNKGTTTVSGGTITASGASATGIFHNSGATTTVSNTAVVANAAKATGIYNTASGITVSNGSVAVTGASGTGNVATGIFNSSTGTLNPSGTSFTVNNYGVGIYNEGTLNATNATITVSGTEATGIYAKSGSLTLTTPVGNAITASGSNSTAIAFGGGTLTLPAGFTLNATGNNSLGLYNDGTTLTTTPVINVSGLNATGVYNQSGKTITVTGNITASGNTGLAGIYNAGTLTNSTGTITVNAGKSVAIFNAGAITAINGAINVTGTSGNLTIGIYNDSGKTISAVNGNITAGNYATAIFNLGNMTVNGSAVITASGTAFSTGIFNQGAGNLTLNGAVTVNVTGTNGTGIYNDSTNGVTMTNGTVNVGATSNKSAGLYHIGTGAFTFGGSAVINATGEEDAGVFNVGTATGVFNVTGGTITATGINSKGSVGVYNEKNPGTGALPTLNVSGGSITATNKNSTGIYNEGTVNLSGGSINTSGESTTGFYNNGAATVINVTGGTVNTDGYRASAIYDSEGTINFNGNSTINASQGATGLYISAGTVTTSSGTVTTINVNNTLVSPTPGAGEGVGVFASDNGTTGSNVDLSGSHITVVGGSSAVASYGAGPGAGTSNLNLTGATVDYDGDGFAVYSNGQYGKIDMTNAQLHLRGNSTGIEIDYSSGSNPITFSGTTIDVWSPNVILANIKDYPTAINVSALLSGISGALGPGVTVNDHTSGQFTYGRLDGGTLNIDTNISRSDTSGAGYDYYNRFLGQRLVTNVLTGISATAVLNTADATAHYNNQIIGLEANSSINAVSPSETQINLQGTSHVDAARTDAGAGAVGLYMNYGEVDIASGAAVNVQQGYTTATGGVGVFGVNGSVTKNAGTIKVAGANSIGILAKGYRTNAGVNDIGAEFGAAAADQGKITITNSGTITMDSAASIGIYADNNTGDGTLPSGTPVRSAADSVVTNTGTITVPNGNSATDMSLGLAGSKVTLKNSGNITVGDYGVGIYGDNGSIIDAASGGNLGTIKVGGNSVAIMGSGSTIASTVTSVTLLSDNTTQDKIGIMYDGGAANINFDIDGSGFKKGTVIFLKDPGTNFTYGSAGKVLKVGANGVGIYLSETTGPAISATNAGSVDLLSGSTSAVGMYTDQGTIVNSGTINIQDNSGQTGMFASGVNAAASNTGTIALQADKGTGIYLENGASLTSAGTINFGTSAEGIGLLLDSASANAAGLSINADNTKKNILVYAKDTGGVGSTVSNSGTISVDGQVLPATSDKTIGVYLKHNSAQNTYTGGTLNVTNGALGVYSAGDNLITGATIDASTKGTVGVYIDGASELANDTITARGALTGESVIGVYANGGVVTVTGGLNLVTGSSTDFGTGMVLTAGATVTGATISVTNASSATNVGLYYSGTSGTLAQGTNLSLAGGNLVGIYADGGLGITNANAITYSSGTSLIGAYVSGGSTYTSTSTTDNIATASSAGILAGKGSGTNSGTLTVGSASSAAMAALAKAATDTATVINDTGATIQVNAGTGMLVGEDGTTYVGTSKGENKGTINAAAGAVGAVLAGSHGTFDGTGGTLNAAGSSSVGLYLDNTGAGQVTALGTLGLGASDAIGVYADRSDVDFNLTLGAGVTQGIGLFAQGTSADGTLISGNVDASASTGTIGVFLNNDYVTFSGTTIKSSHVGLYLNKTISNYTLTGVTVEAQNSGVVGIYIGADSTNPTNVMYSATTTISAGGVGIYVPSFATLDTSGGTININGSSSVGIILDGGTGNLGVAGTLALNFGPMGGMGVLVKNNGTLTIGPNLTITGTGALAAVENASLSNGGTISVNGSTALLGNFTSGGPYTLENLSTGILNVTGGGVGIAALGTAGAATVDAKNAGVINVSGKDGLGNSSVGIYSTTAAITNSGNINVGADGIGIYANNTNNTVTNSGHIALNGAGAIGIIVGGATAGMVNGYTSIDGGDETIGLYLDAATGTVDAGRITLGDDAVGIYADGGTVTLTGGAVTVGGKTAISPLGIFAIGGANLTINPGVTVTGGDGVIAIGADGSTITGADPTAISIAPGGVQLYVANGGSIAVTGGGPLTANDNVGLMVNGSGSITGVTSIDVYNGGIGAYFIGSTAPVPVINVYDGVGGANPKYSIGAYLSGLGGAVTLPTINQIGNYTIGVVAEEGTTASLGAISLAGTASNQIGLVSKGTTAFPNNITVGNISVAGADNIGVYGEETAFTTGNITVADAPASSGMAAAPIGLYAEGGSVTAGSITAGKNAIGLYGSDIGAAGISTLAVTADEGGIGLYATGSGTETVTVNGNVTVAKAETIGVYGKDVNLNVTGDISVGQGTSVGLVSEGSGNIVYSGKINVANKGTSSGSIGIYKDGNAGTITTTNDPWTIGDGGYGFYLTESGGAITLNNNADLTLGTSGVGIYAKGNVVVNNAGNIEVGATDLGPAGDHSATKDHQNSVAFYLTEGAKAYNTGTIDSDKDHSVGAYVSTAAYFENAAGGVINVNNGGVGVLAKHDPDSTNPLGGVAVNNGTINVGATLSSCGRENVGMAAYTGARVENGATGVINVWNGVGLYAGNNGVINNIGVINLYSANAVGVGGNGTLVNEGVINVIGGGTANSMTVGGTVEEGSVLIDATGIKINGNYVSIGGSLRSDIPVKLNGPYVDIIHFGSTAEPLFTAPSISGVIHLTPNFAKLGNGYAYVVDNFVKALEDSHVSKVTIATSPMFIAKEAGGKLYVAKKPYVELMAPGIIGLPEKSQFYELYQGLDNILYLSDPAVPNKSADMLKGLNGYLEQVYATDGTLAFNNEAARTLAETRGDIYGTIQTRMQHVKAAFDQGFEDLFNSYNISKDSSKYAVIYRQGSFADDTLGVDDYEYRVQGLLYMKEYEGRNYGNKWGWTLGFGVSRFDFDDAPRLYDKSKEDVYSVRAGAHFVKNLNEEDSLRWISRAEIGYNRHQAERSLELGDIAEDYTAYEKTYKNKGAYNSYQFRLDNKLEKTLFRTLTAKVDVWAALNMEYGVISKFSEKGDGLYLDVKGRDYFSVRPEVGVSGHKRAYIGKKLSMKLEGKLSYGHEFGDFYNENRARLSEGNQGWYDLIRPEKEEGAFKAGAGLTFEKANKLGVTFDVEAKKHTNKSDVDYSVGVKFKYVLDL